MPRLSRRRALHAAASAAALGLAGCSGETGSSNSGPSLPDREPVNDYVIEKVRNADGTVLFHLADAVGDAETERGTPRRVYVHDHVTDQADLEAVTFESDLPEAATLSEFVTAADLETESVFLVQRHVSECRDIEVTAIQRGPDSVHVDTCLDLRPADVECREGDKDLVALAIRLPFPGDDFSQIGIGTSSRCHEMQPFDPEAYNSSVAGAESGGGSP